MINIITAVIILVISSSVVIAGGEGGDYNVTQVHISQGKSPEYMTVSWATHSSCESEVHYGLSPDNLEWKAFGDSDSYVYESYMYPKYYAPYIHHVVLSQLKPDTTYYYRVGDFIRNTVSTVRSFTTLHAIGDMGEMAVGVIGDLGQTSDSLSTLRHLEVNQELKLILHAGDLSYANCDQTRWDSYGMMTEFLAARRPWMVGAGNHEIESSFDGGYFLAFEKRYRMNTDKTAQFGDVTIPTPTNPDGSQQCTPSVFQMEYNYGNSFYSLESGGLHSIFLNCYSTNDMDSEQYQWLERDLASVDREVTPWVVVAMHCPWYNSNTAHYEEKHTVSMRENLEEIFYSNNVNLVVAGHVHAYERSHPVFKAKLTSDASTYITIGDAGNAEGHSDEYVTPTPEWSAFRNGTQYGHGVIRIHNESHMQWEWHRNIDGEPVLRDSVIICNSALGGLQSDCTEK